MTKSPDATEAIVVRLGLTPIWLVVAILETEVTVSASPESRREPVEVESVKTIFIPTSKFRLEASSAKSKTAVSAGVAPTTPMDPDWFP